MGASDYVAEEENHDGAGDLAAIHITELIERLAMLAAIEMEQRDRTVEAEERFRREGLKLPLKLIESLAAQLCLKFVRENPGRTGKEDEVFRMEVRRKMVEIIEKAIKSAAAQAYKMFRSRSNGFSMEESIKGQIQKVALNIAKRQWARIEEEDVVSVNRESQTAADHEVAKLKKELDSIKARLSYANERCTQLEEDNSRLKASHKKHDDLSEQCARLKEENESKEKRCAELEEENKKEIIHLRKSTEKRCAELEEEFIRWREIIEKLCAELEKEIRLLRGSRQREDSPEDGDLASPNSVSPSNFSLQVGPQDPAEGAAVTVETTPAPTGAERSETIKELKNVMKLSEAATFFAVGVLLGLLTFHRENESVEPQTPAYKAFKFCILVTFACGLSMSLLTICDFSASYKMPIIRGLVYETRGFLLLSGVCVCIAFKKAIDLLAFVPVIVEVIVACIIVYYKNRVSSGQPLPTNRRLLP